MRKEFAQALLGHAKRNKDVILLTGDLGFGTWDSFKEELPEQFYNVGAAESAMMDIAVGLSLSGKLPFCYSITPFLIYRCFETLRTYIDHEKLNVKLIGSGRDNDYKHDGFSHDGTVAQDYLDTLEAFLCHSSILKHSSRLRRRRYHKWLLLW